MANLPDPGLSQWLGKIINDHSGLNFVQRILKPNAWPSLPLPNGYTASHLMAAELVDDRPMAFPTVVYDKETNALKQLDIEAAKKYARDSGEYIPFNSMDDAIKFSTTYKTLWGGDY